MLIVTEVVAEPCDLDAKNVFIRDVELFLPLAELSQELPSQMSNPASNWIANFC